MAGNNTAIIDGGKTVQITVSLSAELKARIEEAARGNMRSVSSEMAYRVARSFDAEKKEG